MMDHKHGISQRKVARRLGCHQSTVIRILKNETNIRCYKKVKKPKRTEQQQQQAKPKCRKMVNLFRNVDFVLDDESYFTLSNTTLSGNDNFYSSDRNLTPEDVKHHFMKKFEEKVLVWAAASSSGISKLRISASGQAITGEVYLKECIQKRLVPFLKEHHKDDNYVFWPDQAKAHYAKHVLDWMEQNNIKYVPKSVNPANLPEVRPIEDFWAYFKREVYKHGWKAKNT